jgi:hypothetical protein
MNREGAEHFTAAMLRAFGGYPITQDTLSHVSTDLLGLDLSVLIPWPTVTLGPMVYVKAGLEPWEQVSAVTFACQHLSQFSANPLEWLWFYTVQPEVRARYIVEALRARMELEAMRGNAKPPSRDEVETLLRYGYGLGEGDIQLGMLLAERAVTSIQAGHQSTQAARIAVEVLRRAGEL